MGLILYIAAAVLGAFALAAYCMYSRTQNDRAISSYTMLIAAVSLLVLADGVVQYINDLNITRGGIGAAGVAIKVTLTVISNVWTAVLLPVCAAALSRSPITVAERVLITALGVALGACNIINALAADTLFRRIDPFLFAAIIAYSLLRLFLKRKSIPHKFITFINASLAFHALCITGLLVYFYIISPVSIASIHYGFTAYFILWNGLNLAALFLLFSRGGASRTQLSGPLAQIRLTGREEQIVDLLCEGHANDRIADTLGVSIHTAKNHLKSVYAKTGIRTRSALVAAYGQHARAKAGS